MDQNKKTYLVVMDDSPEFTKALRYAARMAALTGGHVGILQTINLVEVQSWGAVEERLKGEIRQAAEKQIWETCKLINELNGQIPAIFVADGDREKNVVDIANDPQNGICLLVLAAAVTAGGPGPLIKYLTAKGLNSLKVPVVLVPGHLDDIWIDEI